MENNTIRKLENGRAEFAYNFAVKIDSGLKEKFASHVKSFPMLIKTNGLGASLAFLFSKKGKEKGVYDKVGESISEWLKKDDKYKYYQLSTFTDLQSLVNQVISLNSSDYRALTVEVLAYFNWLRRFAEGLNPKKEG